jgi:hypothetical protein
VWRTSPKGKPRRPLRFTDRDRSDGDGTAASVRLWSHGRKRTKPPKVTKHGRPSPSRDSGAGSILRPGSGADLRPGGAGGDVSRIDDGSHPSADHESVRKHNARLWEYREIGMISGKATSICVSAPRPPRGHGPTTTQRTAISLWYLGVRLIWRPRQTRCFDHTDETSGWRRWLRSSWKTSRAFGVANVAVLQWCRTCTRSAVEKAGPPVAGEKNEARRPTQR